MGSLNIDMTGNNMFDQFKWNGKMIDESCHDWVKNVPCWTKSLINRSIHCTSEFILNNMNLNLLMIDHKTNNAQDILCVITLNKIGLYDIIRLFFFSNVCSDVICEPMNVVLVMTINLIANLNQHSWNYFDKSI